MKIFKDALTHNGSKCDVCYVETDHFDDIPDEQIQKAHAVCICDGKMLLVNHSEWNIWGIPGGTREDGESIEQTLAREILEEANCEVLDFTPISYQKIVDSKSDVSYRTQYICNVRPLGEFESDPAGNINKITWVTPQDSKGYIENKDFKQAVIDRALSVLGIS